MTLATGRYAEALGKIGQRAADFREAGWKSADLTCCAVQRYGHHSLALMLRQGQDIGRIWKWCCEILGCVGGNGKRSRLYHWKGAPLCELTATFGANIIIPTELREEWRVAKL